MKTGGHAIAMIWVREKSNTRLRKPAHRILERRRYHPQRRFPRGPAELKSRSGF